MAGLRIHFLQHVAFEGPGSIGEWIRERGHRSSFTRLYEDEALPDTASLDWLVVMGGPMGVYDEDRFPWLKREKFFIENCIRGGKPVIGICLGAQLIAAVLGARVYHNSHREIGWFPVTVTGDARQRPPFRGFPDEVTVFHWHGDTFDLPAGALHCAASKACENQMFLYGTGVLGIQFHFEVTEKGIRDLITECRDEMSPDTYVQDEFTILEKLATVRENNRLMERILQGIADQTPE